MNRVRTGILASSVSMNYPKREAESRGLPVDDSLFLGVSLNDFDVPNSLTTIPDDGF